MSHAIKRGAIAVAAAAYLSALPLPANADLPMVSPSEVTAAAKPLAKQPVQKGKVWLLLAGGSATLFAATVLLERSKVFPAIAKANEAMTVSKAAREDAADAEQQEQALDLQPEGSAWVEDAESSAAVLQGLQSASTRVLSEPRPSATTEADDTVPSSSADPGVASTEHLSSESKAESSKSSTGSPTAPPAAAQPMRSSASKSQIEQSKDNVEGLVNSEPLPDAQSGSGTPPQQPAGVADSPSPPDSSISSSSAEAVSTRDDTAESSPRDTSSLTSKQDVDSEGSSTDLAKASATRTAASPLSEMSSADLERLISAKKQQQQEKLRQQEDDAAIARRRQEQAVPAGKDLADLSVEELQSLIASKRKMAANVVKTVVDP